MIHRIGLRTGPRTPCPAISLIHQTFAAAKPPRRLRCHQSPKVRMSASCCDHRMIELPDLPAEFVHPRHHFGLFAGDKFGADPPVSRNVEMRIIALPPHARMRPTSPFHSSPHSQL